MTVRILRTMPEPTRQLLVDHLEEHVRPQLQADVSNYAKGRLRAWIPYEAPLSAVRDWAPGLDVPQVWRFLQQIGQEVDFPVDTALVSIGGGITRHRDASYAAFKAIGVNLGPVTFCYENIYPDYHWVPNTPESGPVERHELTGGEIFAFNCKNAHWVEDAAPDRWAFNLWQISNKEIGRFEEFKGLNPFGA